MTRDGVMDIGEPPPEPEIQPEPQASPPEDFRAKALRRAQEEEMRRQEALQSVWECQTETKDVNGQLWFRWSSDGGQTWSEWFPWGRAA